MSLGALALYESNLQGLLIVLQAKGSKDVPRSLREYVRALISGIVCHIASVQVCSANTRLVATLSLIRCRLS
jgi:hypothetical protein